MKTCLKLCRNRKVAKLLLLDFPRGGPTNRPNPSGLQKLGERCSGMASPRGWID